MTSIKEVRAFVENNTAEVEKTLCELTGAKRWFAPDVTYLLRDYVEYLCKDLTVEEAMNLDEETQEYLYECYESDDSWGEDFAEALTEICKLFCY